MAKAKDNKNIKKIVAGALAVIMLGSSGISVIAGLKNSKNSGTGTGTTISVNTSGFDFSKAFDDRGYFKDVTALDYVELADYKNIEIPEELKTITEDQLISSLSSISQNYRTHEFDSTPGAVVHTGDTVNIDYVGSVDGVEFVGGTTKGMGTALELGSGSYIGATDECEGFEEQIVGHEVGETFDITVQFPHVYSSSKDADGNDVVLADKVAVFTVTINSVEVTIFPEINDEFVAENLSETYESYDDLVQAISDSITKSQIENYVWSEILENSTVKSNPEAVENYLKELSDYNYNEEYAYMQQVAEYYETDLATLLALYGCTSFDEYYSNYGQDPMEDLEASVISQALAEAEGIEMTDELLEQFFTEVVGVEDYSEYIQSFGTNYIKYAALSYSVLEKVMENY